MNLLTISRKLKSTPFLYSARRNAWPSNKAIVYTGKIRSFTVKEGGAIYLFTTQDVLGNDWELQELL